MRIAEIDLFEKEKDLMGGVFQTRQWWGLFKGGVGLGVYDKDDLVGVGGFWIDKSGVKFLGMEKISGQELTDYGDIVFKKDYGKKVWEEILKYFSVKHLNLKMVLDYVREDSETFKVLGEESKEKQEVAPFINLEDSWEKYLSGLNKKKRHELKRKTRRVEEMGEVKFSVSGSIDDKQINDLLDLIKQSSRVKLEFMNDEVKAFFVTMIKKMSEARFARLFSLNIDGKITAMCLGFKYRGVLYLYNSGFNHEKGVSVGVVLMSKIIEWAIQNRLREVDFLRGGERYKYDLGATDRQLWKITINLKKGR